ncbi:MAG: hypothetical protein M1812_002768 [Candelaria pacifica]|nr:MAG: hypothetical protein M1812_002768 [Candelaria pacifica]
MCHEILTEFKTCGHTVPFVETCSTYLTTSRPCATLSDPETLPAQDGYCFDCLQKQSDEEAAQRSAARAAKPQLFYKSRTTYKNCGHSDVVDTEIEREEGDPEILDIEERGQCWDCAKIPQSELDQMRKLAGMDAGGAKEGEVLVLAGGSGANGGNRGARSYKPEIRNAFDDLEEESPNEAGRARSPEIDESSRKGKGRAVPADSNDGNHKGKGKIWEPESRSPSPVAPMHGGRGRTRSTSRTPSEYSFSGSEDGSHGYGERQAGETPEYSDYEEEDDEYRSHEHGNRFPHGRTPPPQWGSGGRGHGRFDGHPVEGGDHLKDREHMTDPRDLPNWGGSSRQHPLEKQMQRHGNTREKGEELPEYGDDEASDEGRDVGKL